VSEKAQADVTVEPAPPVSPPEAPKAKVETEEEKPHVIIPDHLKDKVGCSQLASMSCAQRLSRCPLSWKSILTTKSSLLAMSCS
jgi:hypothetical protein